MSIVVLHQFEDDFVAIYTAMKHLEFFKQDGFSFADIRWWDRENTEAANSDQKHQAEPIPKVVF